uniref:Uncharacterized protein n=1 Tax=Branchiostoma floridae TaxID=7739 RepID=C3YAJ8_BRAFL|eukprot:XP_002606736.1 hypothetical protein BRAFLDRAFT_82376 [Branchiostoma floridae]
MEGSSVLSGNAPTTATPGQATDTFSVGSNRGRASELTQPHWSFVTAPRRILRAEIVQGGQIFSWVFCSIEEWLLGEYGRATEFQIKFLYIFTRYIAVVTGNSSDETICWDDHITPCPIGGCMYVVISRAGTGLQQCFHGILMKLGDPVHVRASVVH